MASTYRVDITLERTVTFYVQAEDDAAVEAFLENNDEWQPGDVPGLIDIVGEESEMAYLISEAEPGFTAGFEINDDLELVEIE